MSAAGDERAGSATALRWALLGLAALTIVATTVELAMERHWKTALQITPWFGVGALVVALALVAVRPRRPAVHAARAIAVAVLALSAFGVFEHVRANYDAGPLDYRYANRWDSMSEGARWLRAATKSVGPAPVLAAGVLAQGALLTVAATIRHPALAR